MSANDVVVHLSDESINKLRELVSSAIEECKESISNVSTPVLVEELKKREGVEKFGVRENEYCVISALDVETNAGPMKEYNDKCIVIVEVE